MSTGIYGIPIPHWFPRNEQQAEENRAYIAGHKLIARRGRLQAIERKIKEDDAAAELRTAMMTGAPLLQVAQFAADLAATDIGIPGQKVLALGADHIRRNPRLLGFPHGGRDNTIEVRASDVCAFEVAITAVHEVCHRGQYLSDRFLSLLGEGKTESEAEQFAAKFAARCLANFACTCAGGPFKK